MGKKCNLNFARKAQPKLAKIMVEDGVPLKESKEISKKLALIGQAFGEVASNKC